MAYIQTIAEMPEMMNLFDEEKNMSAASDISVRDGVNKYWFLIEGQSFLVAPRTIFDHLNSGADWNLNRLGREKRIGGVGQYTYYISQTDFATKNGLSQQQVSRLLKSGYTYADIEQGKHLKVNDHLGNRYKSKAAMAQAYGLSKFVFDKREKAGWSLDRILTTPVDESKTPKKHLR